MTKKEEKLELLKEFGFKETEIHHFKTARKDYICQDCKQTINKSETYFAELSTIFYGRGIINNIVGRICIKCIKEKIKYQQWIQDRTLPEKGF